MLLQGVILARAGKVLILATWGVILARAGKVLLEGLY